VSIATSIHSPQVSEPYEVFEHHLQERLGDTKRLGQILIAMDPTAGHKQQKAL
jgi:hypothetical protein